MKQPWARMLEATSIHAINKTAEAAITKAQERIKAHRSLTKRVEALETELKALKDRRTAQ